MEVSVVRGDITQQAVGAIVVNLFEGVKSPGGGTGAVDRALDGAVSNLIEDGEITGKRGELTLIHTLGKMAPDRVLVAGLGKSAELDLDAVRAISAQVCRRLRRAGVARVATIAHGAGIGGLDAGASAQAVAEGAILGLYRFDKYKSEGESSNAVESLTIVEAGPDKVAALEAGAADGVVLAEAVNLCRDMSNEPANCMTPTRMAEVALEVARDAGLEIEVIDRPQMEEKGMGALLGVAQGSREPPKLIVLRYEGDPDNADNGMALIGKGITFDSGGISIKPSPRMGEMKGDMAGGASVISAMKAIGALRPKINVTAIVPATENMPGGSAQRPGDIVRSMSGKTIEIDNTDAEGRLVLADALAYAKSVGLSRVVDVATLTGAMVVALGHLTTGVFGNDQGLIDSVLAAGGETGEKLWALPTFDDYKDQLKSDVADLKNVGGRPAGSITGAQFIGEFAEGMAWVHLDIAGTSRTDKEKGYNVKGATGVPVRTLVALARGLAAD